MAYRTPRKKEVKGRALTDPQPAFVSIVQAGANQAPFRMVKMDLHATEGVGDMHERIKAMKAQGHEVASLRFHDVEKFPDVEAVKAWLTEGGYSEDAIGAIKDAQEGGFEVQNTTDSFVEGSIVQIKDAHDLGVTVWVGKLEVSEDAAKDEDGGPATARAVVTDVEVIGKKEDAETETRTGKGDERAAPAAEEDETEKGAHPKKKKPKRKVTSAREISRSTTLDTEFDAEQATKDGAEAVEKQGQGDGTKTIVHKFDITVENAEAFKSELMGVAGRRRKYLDEEITKKFDDFFAHFSEALTMGGVMADANDGLPIGFGETIQATVVAMRNNIVEENMDGVRAVAEEFGNMVAALAALSVGDEGEGTQRAQKTIDLFGEAIANYGVEENEPAEEDAGEENADGGEIILKAISDLAETVKANAAKTDAAIEEFSVRVTAVEKAAADVSEKMNERVKSLESDWQTRKSADVDGDESAAQRDTDPLSDRVLRGSLGIAYTAPQAVGR